MDKKEPRKHHERIDILFEDEYICIINKPVGILSVPSQGKDKSALTIIEEIMRKKGTYSANTGLLQYTDSTGKQAES